MHITVFQICTLKKCQISRGARSSVINQIQKIQWSNVVSKVTFPTLDGGFPALGSEENPSFLTNWWYLELELE